MSTCTPLFGFIKRKHAWKDTAFGYHYGAVERQCKRCGKYERVSHYLTGNWVDGRAHVASAEERRKKGLK